MEFVSYNKEYPNSHGLNNTYIYDDTEATICSTEALYEHYVFELLSEFTTVLKQISIEDKTIQKFLVKYSANLIESKDPKIMQDLYDLFLFTTRQRSDSPIKPEIIKYRVEEFTEKRIKPLVQ